METLQVQPFQPIPKSLKEEKSGAESPYSPFLEYAKQSFLGITDSIFDYAQGFYNVMGGVPENLHTVEIHAYQGSTLQKLAGVVASLLVKAVNSFMSINI